MRILLVGEYSRLHNSLKEGLELLGHSVIILGFGDGFKNYTVDIQLRDHYESWPKRKLKNLIYRLFNYDLKSQNIKSQILSFENQLKNFDVVQYINEAPFGCLAPVEKEIFDTIKSWNKKIFLLSCGADYISMKYAMDDKFRYSILNTYKEQRGNTTKFSYGLHYLEPEFESLHHHIYKHINGVIASDFDYHIPLKNHPQYLGLVPNPINTDVLQYHQPKIDDKIVIFHGINTKNYFKKGNYLFEEALELIAKKYSEKIKVITLRSVPYNAYISAYNEAHILLDQVYAYDQGYNALEAMAKGKVVFTGAEQEWLDHYNLEEDTVAINALPDANQIASKLEWLILHPKHIVEISMNARAFIEKEHHYTAIAERYLSLWNNH